MFSSSQQNPEKFSPSTQTYTSSKEILGWTNSNIDLDYDSVVPPNPVSPSLTITDGISGDSPTSARPPKKLPKLPLTCCGNYPNRFPYLSQRYLPDGSLETRGCCNGVRLYIAEAYVCCPDGRIRNSYGMC